MENTVDTFLRRSKIFEILRENGLLTKKNLPSQKAIDLRVLQLKITTDKEGKSWNSAIMTAENLYEFQKRYTSKEYYLSSEHDLNKEID